MALCYRLLGKSVSIISCVLCHCIQVRRLSSDGVWKSVSRSWNVVLYFFELLKKHVDSRSTSFGTRFRSRGESVSIILKCRAVPFEMLGKNGSTVSSVSLCHCQRVPSFHRLRCPIIHRICDAMSLLTTLCCWYSSHRLHGVLVHVSVVHGRIVVSYMPLNIEVHLPSGSVPIAAISYWAGTFSRQIRPVKKQVTALLN